MCRELVPIRYGRMLVSPFTFFRGAALIMAADLSRDADGPGITVQLCGDAHLSNFGVFGSPERQADLRHQRLRRDAPRAVGVGREAAGRELRGRAAATAASARPTGARSCSAGVRTYRKTMRRAADDAGARRLVRPPRRRRDPGGVRARRCARSAGEGGCEEPASTSRRPGRATTFVCSRSVGDGRRRATVRRRPAADRADRRPGRRRDRARRADAWIGRSSHVPPPLAREHHPFEEYRLVDTARKVVGVGSVGTRAWIHLSSAGTRRSADPAGPRRLSPRSWSRSSAERIHEPRPAGGRRPAADAGGDRHLPRLAAGRRTRRACARLLHPAAARLEGRRRAGTFSAPGRGSTPELCGATLARAHARWGDRIAIATYLGRGDVSTERWRPSLRRTPTRTSGTTRRSSPP